LIRRSIETLLPRNSSARHVGVLASGTAVAQAIPIAVSPILTRLYAPEEFGLVALYMACVSVLAVIATARYEMAITLPKSDEDAACLVRFTLKLCALISGLLYIPIYFFGELLANELGNPEVAPWFYLMPLSVLATGAFSVFQFWFNRTLKYNKIASTRIKNAALSASSNIAFGFGHLNGGLILGATVSQLTISALLSRKVLGELKGKFGSPALAPQLAIAKRYATHPKHIAPAQLMGVIAQQIPILIISSTFSLAIAGFFSIAYRLVSLPTGLLANAIGDVYCQKISAAYSARGEFKREFLSTLQKTALMATPPFVLIYFIAPDLFAYVFGDKWRVAGEYARILAVAALFQFIFTPIDKGAVVVGATSYILCWNVLRLAALVILFTIVTMFELSISFALWSLVFINCSLYLLEAVIGYRFSKGNSYDKL